MERDSFVIYRSFLNSIDALNDEQQLEAYRALTRYGLDGEMPAEKGIALALITSFKSQIDANNKKYENGCRGAEAGVRGGAPKGNQNAKRLETEETTPNQPQSEEEQPQNNPYMRNEICIMRNDIYKKENKEKKADTVLTDSELVSLIDIAFSDKNLRDKFIDYANMRAAQGKNKAIRTQAVFDSCVGKLRKYAKTSKEAIEILDNSIANCWTGLFELKASAASAKKAEERVPYAN